QSPTQSSLRTRPKNQVSGKFSQQLQIIKGNRGPGLALACVPDTELKRNFPRRPNSSTHQDLQQQLEPFGLKAKAINRSSTNDKETGHRIFDAQVLSLQRQGSPCAHARNCCTYWIPVAHAIFRRVAAGDCDVATFGDGCEQLGKKMGRMLKVSVDPSQQTSV